MLDFNSTEYDTGVCLDQDFKSGRIDHPTSLRKDFDCDPSVECPHIPEEDTSDCISTNKYRFGPIIGKSRSLQRVFAKMTKTAPSNASVIIYGESGTGKELAAQTIHNLSPRRHKRLIPVNCGAIPEELVESEFFGYKKGAFTGAGRNKPGYLDWADRGTLFLDEVGELSLTMQVKLLRAVDGGGYSPIGSQDIKKPDIRIIAATNRDLRESVRNGLMREDFYYRINVLPISMPPLRARKDDLPLLINHFLLRFCKEEPTPAFPSKLMDLMREYHWPGNIRELQNTIHRYVTLKEIGFLKSPQETAEATPGSFPGFRSDQDLKSAMEEFEKQYIAQCLEATNWHRDKACDILKINRKTLYKKIKRYRLKEDKGGRH